MSKETETRTTFEHSAAIFMGFAFVISLLAIMGWLFNQPVLASLRPEFIPMAPSTGLMLLGLSGAGLIFRINSNRRGMRILLQAALIGMLVIVLILALRYFTGFGPDLEQMLIPNPTLLGQIKTARISPLTAMGFLLAIPAFLLLTGNEPGKRKKNAAAGLALIVLILSSLNILGYIYGAPPFYGGTLIPVAVTTALAFLFLSLGLLMYAGSNSWPVRMYVGPSLKARLLRAFIPAAFVIVLLQGLLSTASAPWIFDPALRVAISAFVATVILFLVISLTANNLSKEFENSERARLKAENALNQSESRFRTLAETANDAIINIDHDGSIVFWNRAAGKLFDYSVEEVIGKQLDMIMPEKYHAAHHQGLERVVMTGETHIIGTTVELVGLRKGGQEFPLALSLAVWQVGGEVFFTAIGRDISERKRFEEEIRSLSLTDELTGLYNRRGFTLLAEQEVKLAHREGRKLLLLFGDVDNLKAINDTWGHAQGDLALKEISAILKENFRESDILARISGDEFVALALDTSTESSKILTNRIQAALEKLKMPGDGSTQLSISLGFALYDPEIPCSVNELIARADRLMYQQKQARKGKN